MNDTITTPTGAVVLMKTVPAPTNVSDLKEVVQHGETVAAPLAPATGTIDSPTGSPVVVVLTSFWKSPTVRWMLGVLSAAVVAGVLKIAPLLSGPVNWTTIWLNFKGEFIATAISAFMLWMKGHENNPVNGPMAAPEIKNP